MNAVSNNRNLLESTRYLMFMAPGKIWDLLNKWTYNHITVRLSVLPGGDYALRIKHMREMKLPQERVSKNRDIALILTSNDARSTHLQSDWRMGGRQEK
jgi:hypothetical protein